MPRRAPALVTWRMWMSWSVLVYSRSQTTVKYVGAAYLVWFGVRLLIRAVRRDTGAPEADSVVQTSAWRAARQGLATNLLNPKVGVFYVALLPQFIPPHDNPLAVGLLPQALKQLEAQMYQHARDLEFEQAAKVRDEIQKLREIGLANPL